MREHFPTKCMQIFVIILTLALYTGAMAKPVPPDKMKPAEVVAKHLASIGSAEDLAAAQSRVVIGTAKARLNLTNTPVELAGPAQLASQGDSFLLAMLFNSNDYPFEKAGYDGKKLTVGVLTSGGRSPLGAFLTSHDAVIKQGLMGGGLSSAWPLLNMSAKNPKLSYAGTTKIDARTAHELKFSPRNAGELQISLFFDTETFRHLRTEYSYSIPAGMGATPGDSASQRESRFKMIEEFSDFKPEGKLTLPHTYKIRLIIDTQDKTKTLDWALTLSQFAFNQQIDSAAFNVAANK